MGLLFWIIAGKLKIQAFYVGSSRNIAADMLTRGGPDLIHRWERAGNPPDDLDCRDAWSVFANHGPTEGLQTGRIYIARIGGKVR